MRRLLLLLALAPAAAGAQGFAVSGRVVDGVTGAPLARATVSLAPLQAPGAPTLQTEAVADGTTGADGVFRFRGLAPGRYRLSASRRGFETANYEEHEDFFAAAIVGPGKSTEGLRFGLEPHATIRGTVLDSSGDPVEAGNVTLFARAVDGSGSIQRVRSTFVQRGDGLYEFADLAPGSYYVAVSARPWFAETAESGTQTLNPLDAAYPLTFFDGADSEAAAQPLVVRAGETVQANFALRAMPSVHIRIPAQPGGGFQFPQLESPAFGTAVPVMLGTVSRGTGREGETPEFSLSVAPGTYALRQGDENRVLHVGADVTVSPESSPGGTAEVSGKLAMANGSALPAGVALRLESEEDMPGVSAPVFFGGRAHGFRGGRMGLSERPLEAKLSGDGMFRLGAVPTGEYRLALSGGGSLAIAGAAASGGRISSGLLLRVGSEPVTLAATVARATSSVSGRVVDRSGRPASGAMVLLVPETGEPATLYREDESDSDGTWNVSGVVPGAYRVVAIRDGWDLAWKQPEVLAPYLKAAVAVTVAEDRSVALSGDVPEQAR